MRPREFISSVKQNKSLPPVSVFLGKEEFWKKLHLKYIYKTIFPDQDYTLNCSLFNAADTKIDVVIDELNSFGFFNSDKVICYENVELLDQDSQKKLLSYIDNPNDNSSLILSAEKFDNRKALGKNKILKKVTVNYNVTDDRDKVEFIQYKLKELGDLKIENELQNLLLKSFPENLRLLSANLEKIAAHANYTSPLRIQSAVVINTEKGEISSFKLIDLLMKKDFTRLVQMYRQASSRSNPSFQFLLIGALRSHFENCLRIKQMSDQGFDRNHITSHVKGGSFVVNKVISQIKNFSFNELKSAYADIAECDYRLKSSTISADIMLEVFFHKLCFSNIN